MAAGKGIQENKVMGNIVIADYADDFWKAACGKKGKVVLCGTEWIFGEILPYLPETDYFWDLGGTLGAEFRGIPTIDIGQLSKISDIIYLLVCFKEKEVLEELYKLLVQTEICAKLYHLYDNCAFELLKDDYMYVHNESAENRPLKVRIVNHEGGGWILTKFAQRLKENLNSLGIEADIGEVDPAADINHHIPSHPYLPLRDFNDTLMITHVDTQQKIELLRRQLRMAKMGICMSKDTVKFLEQKGLPREKLCYVNPAHDNNMHPKKYVIGITHRCYDYLDLRKRATSLPDILKGVNPVYFKLIIMGAGWQDIVKEIRGRGFEVEYYDDFDYVRYHELMPSLDFYLYFGFDEGSMGFLDAISAGVETIVTPQGFHLDVENGIDHSCCTIDQFTSVLYDLQYKREKKIASVADWTWENYAKKHIEIWEYILRRKPLTALYKNQLQYEDGIFSCLISDNVIG